MCRLLSLGFRRFDATVFLRLRCLLGRQLRRLLALSFLRLPQGGNLLPRQLGCQLPALVLCLLSGGLLGSGLLRCQLRRLLPLGLGRFHPTLFLSLLLGGQRRLLALGLGCFRLTLVLSLPLGGELRRFLALRLSRLCTALFLGLLLGGELRCFLALRLSRLCTALFVRALLNGFALSPCLLLLLLDDLLEGLQSPLRSQGEWRVRIALDKCLHGGLIARVLDLVPRSRFIRGWDWRGWRGGWLKRRNLGRGLLGQV